VSDETPGVPGANAGVPAPEPDGPAVPEPDAKDWTWVLDSPCPDCGFDAATIDRARIGALVRETSTSWQQALSGGEVRLRPDRTTWSVLEYGAHCRDVYLVFGERLRLMMTEDDPQFANWDQDATAVEKRYWEGDPNVVAAELAHAAAAAADGFDAVGGEQWARTGRRSNGSVFTVETLGKYFLHDLVHHLHDVDRPMVAERSAT
jgi:hypothetical protein